MEVVALARTRIISLHQKFLIFVLHVGEYGEEICDPALICLKIGIPPRIGHLAAYNGKMVFLPRIGKKVIIWPGNLRTAHCCNVENGNVLRAPSIGEQRKCQKSVRVSCDGGQGAADTRHFPNLSASGTRHPGSAQRCRNLRSSEGVC